MTAEPSTERNQDRNSDHGHHEIHLRVDGEHYTTRDDTWTPNEIIRKFAEKDPATHYLVQVHGHEHISYEGRGNETIKLRDGMRFQVISTGPTPVSDVPR